jgi:probable rRNA maturation factor
MSGVQIAKTVTSYPELSYEAIKDDILGAKYTLSLVFIGEIRAKTLNQTYRNKDYTPDILSFPLDDENGEMFLCLRQIYRTAPQYGRSAKKQVGFLFIHGLLHLKGHTHGATMEAAEQKYCDRFNFA